MPVPTWDRSEQALDIYMSEPLPLHWNPWLCGETCQPLKCYSETWGLRNHTFDQLGYRSYSLRYQHILHVYDIGSIEGNPLNTHSIWHLGIIVSHTCQYPAHILWVPLLPQWFKVKYSCTTHTIHNTTHRQFLFHSGLRHGSRRALLTE